MTFDEWWRKERHPDHVLSNSFSARMERASRDGWEAALKYARPEERWIPVTERVPEGDREVLISHPVFMGSMVIRRASTVRIFTKYPGDTSMADAYWRELPPLPQNRSEEKK